MHQKKRREAEFLDDTNKKSGTADARGAWGTRRKRSTKTLEGEDIISPRR